MSTDDIRPPPHWREDINAIIEAVPEPIVIVDVETITYVAVNSAAARLVRRTREDVVRLGPAVVAADPGITVATLRRRYAQLIESYPQGRTQDNVIRRSDGSAFRGRYHRQAARLDGRWVMVLRIDDLGTLAAPDSEASFRNVVELSTDAVGIVDVERNRLIEVNHGALALLGYSREQLLEEGLTLGLTGSAEQEWQDLFRRLVHEAPRARVTEGQLRRKDGSHVPVQITQQAVDDRGRWIVILTARDITERVEARRALEQRVQDLARSNQELERFAYVVSHDLMEPLRMMASYSQLLDRRYRKQLDADAGEFIDFIVSGAKRMKLLLDDLLAYSRVGRMGGRLVPVNVGEVLDDVIANLRVLVEEKSAVIERGPMPIVLHSRTELTQLLQNLVSNALKFQAAGVPPRVRIEAAESPDHWTFRVADNGIGVAPEHFERIFVIFQRLHDRQAYGGTGIGLAICKKIVEHRGGRIWVESQPGAGTTFHFTVPHGQT